MTGKKIGKWTVQYRTEDRYTKGGYRRTFWHCKCDCGNEKDVASNILLSGQSQSCGCLHKDNLSKRFKEMHLKNRTTYDLLGEFGIGYTYDNNYFYFDKEDYIKIKDYNWFKNDQGYFLARICSKEGEWKTIRLHRVVMDENRKEIEVDHIHGKESRFDNRKNNLRLATHSQNNINKGNQKNNTSGVRGVNFDKNTQKWRARITKNKINYELGYYNTLEDATKARKEAEEKYFGEWSYDNSVRR